MWWELNHMCINCSEHVFLSFGTTLLPYPSIVQGQAEGVMCGYAALNGVPSCQDPLLMQTLLRDEWKSTALVQTDCCDSMFDWVGPPGKGYYPTRVDSFIAASKIHITTSFPRFKRVPKFGV